MQAVEEKIKGSGGNFVMQMAPKAIQAFHVADANDNLKATFIRYLTFSLKVVTATDEDELAARIRKAEEENAEVKIENLVFVFSEVPLLSPGRW